MRVVCISDTHGFFPTDIPDGDILIHGGDLTSNGTQTQVVDGMRWLGHFPHKHKVLIAGNHDFWFEKATPADLRQWVPEGVHYLQDRMIELEGFRIYGSPWQPWFFNWAFNLHHKDLVKMWDQIPDDTQILVTHGPSRGIRDRTQRGEEVGCVALRERVSQLRDLRLHVCGHIHEAYGTEDLGTHLSVNASVCDLLYRPRNPAVVVDL